MKNPFDFGFNIYLNGLNQFLGGLGKIKAGFEGVDKAVKSGERLREVAASTAKVGLVMGGVGAA